MANSLRNRRGDFELAVVGDPGLEERDRRYLRGLKEMVKKFGLEERVVFFGGVTNDEAAGIYPDHDLFINMTAAGSFDKTIGEAMACGVPVITNNKEIASHLPEELKDLLILEDEEAGEAAGKAEKWLELDEGEKKRAREEVRKIIVEKHSVDFLARKIKELV